MKTIIDFAVLAAPFTFAGLALLFFARRHIYRQMDQIVKADAPPLMRSRRCADDCSCNNRATLHME